MASRAWASAEAVTVQVLTTTMSAAAAVGAEMQPRSSNWRSRAAPSACVARQPNCSMKKVAMCMSRGNPNILHGVPVARREHAKERLAVGSRLDLKKEGNHQQNRSRTCLYSPKAAPLQSFDTHGPSTTQPLSHPRSAASDCDSRLQREAHD